MCGRYTLHARHRIKLKGLTALDLPFEARYNIAPSQKILAIADFGKGIEGRMLTWGLIPSWSMDGKGFINARAETLEERPSFSESFRFRRCLLPADGFFEWEADRKREAPIPLSIEGRRSVDVRRDLGHLAHTHGDDYYVRHHHHAGKRVGR